jgi:hypothetical protein
VAGEQQPTATLPGRVAVLGGFIAGAVTAVVWYVMFALLFDEHSAAAAIAGGVVSGVTWVLSVRRRVQRA